MTDPALPDLIVNDARFALWGEPGKCGTGIFVRAKRGGKWGSYDIVVLTRESLEAFLRSRGGKNEWAESVVYILLGHNS